MMENLISYLFSNNSILTTGLGSILITIYFPLIGLLYKLNYKIEDKPKLYGKGKKFKRGLFDEELNKLLTNEFISIIMIILFYFIIKNIPLLNVNILQILIIGFFFYKYIKIIRYIFHIKHIINN